MGCILSSAKDEGGASHSQGQRAEVFVFVPGMRVPKSVDFARALHGRVSSSMVERISALRTRIEVIAAGDFFAASTKPKRKAATQQGGLTITDLQQAVEDYLPVLLVLTKEGSPLRDAVEFAWTNQEDEQQETRIASSLYELLSVLHLMAILGLSQANLLLTPRPPADGYQPKTTEENKKEAIETFLKVSGILECAINSVLPQMSEDLKRKLPADLRQGVLHALSVQALGQGVEIQLGLAIDNVKATLAVKRRLACEQVKYWKQAQESMQSVHVGSGWGEKHNLFISWKLAEAKAGAYYYHGLILHEGNEENIRAKAVVCLQTAESFLKESQKICENFCMMTPATRSPPLWGALKYLSEKIPKDAVSKARVNRDSEYHEIAFKTAPDLPDFHVALQAEEYNLPSSDETWEVDAMGC